MQKQEKQSKSEKFQKFLIIPEIIIILFLFGISIFTIMSSKNEDGLPAGPITGTCFLPVQSNSMAPLFTSGDLVIGKKLSQDEIGSLEKGDIITYKVYQGSGFFLNTHRISKIEDGKIYTQGDNAEEAAKEGLDTNEVYVPNDYILAKYKTRVKGIGSVLNYFQDRKNYTVFILIPLLVLFLWNIYSFMKVLFETKRQSMIDKAVKGGEISDEVKALAIQEYLEKQKAMAEAQNNTVKEEVPQVSENVEGEIKQPEVGKTPQSDKTEKSE